MKLLLILARRARQWRIVRNFMSDKTPKKKSEKPVEKDCHLYLITPPVIDDLADFSKQLTAALAVGGVASVQLRLKDVDDATVLEAAAALMPICHDHDVAFLINDRADLAKLADADGVHLGAGDGMITEARELLGFERAIGYTCKDSIDLGYQAGEAGADYVAFGAFFTSPTKMSTTRPEIEVLERWSEGTELPCVAIGGITPENCGPLVKAGAHFLAACSSVWDHADGPAAAVKAFNAAIEKA